ncbi:hypothetical protein QNI19_26790 [Cytophagaceae bacterium DM2B3-1]|uniref:Uncharacterized protein n=1 Tax=Xanthocytophaga flava TaxID=3048013 RepID=A0ABT7CVC4_9BACT|nr:hypothetical protein [Xanthocytophaga flavus]MDJ1496569.1 hypothetical protein [Xanthocytophaga flavus]
MKVIPFIPECEDVVIDTLSEQQQLRQSVEAVHENIKPALMQNLESRSKDDLIQSYCNEMDAKNRAYYFILESGLINEFYQFCQNQA